MINKTIMAVAVIAAMIASEVVNAAVKPFSCPAYESNKDPMMVNQTNFGGLWFEYLYSEGYKGDNQYDCASWTMLAPGKQDESKDTFDYDVIFHGINQTTN